MRTAELYLHEVAVPHGKGLIEVAAAEPARARRTLDAGGQPVCGIAVFGVLGAEGDFPFAEVKRHAALFIGRKEGNPLQRIPQGSPFDFDAAGGRRVDFLIVGEIPVDQPHGELVGFGCHGKVVTGDVEAENPLAAELLQFGYAFAGNDEPLGEGGGDAAHVSGVQPPVVVARLHLEEGAAEVVLLLIGGLGIVDVAYQLEQCRGVELQTLPGFDGHLGKVGGVKTL